MKMIKLYRNKGFTLVECVIAIAVFAILTVLIMMMMSMAIETSKKAGAAEEDLNKLVQNVEEDASTQTYNSLNSHVLKMKFGGTATDENFSITYNVIDGFRDYIICPNCGKAFNRNDYLYNIANTDTYKNAAADERQRYGLYHWYDPFGTPGSSDTDEATYLARLVCPDCHAVLKPGVDYAPSGSPAQVLADLECLACLNTGSMYDNSKFTYDNNTGLYYCKSCLSTNIRQKGIQEQVVADSTFSIGNLIPNAIRYSEVKQPSKDDLKGTYFTAKHMTDSTVTVTNYNIALKYLKDSSTLNSGSYQMTISNTGLTGSSQAQFTMALPYGYMFKAVKITDTHGTTYYEDGVAKTSGGATDAYTTCSYASGIDGAPATLTINGVPASGVTIDFTLNSTSSGFAFDIDYTNEGGLLGYWFRIKEANISKNAAGDLSATMTIPREDATLAGE